MSDTPGVPPQPGSAQLERLQQLDRRIAQTVGQLIGSLQDEVDRRLNEATGELQRLFEKMKPAAPDLPGNFLQPEDLSELLPAPPEPPPAPEPPRVSLNEQLVPLLAGLARIDGESGQAPILKALLEESARFSSRAAFLLIRGGEIRGWAARDLPEDALQQSNFATLAGPFTRLLSADGTVVLSAGECAEVASLLSVEPAWCGALVPFQIRGQLAGALYADRLEEEELAIAALQVLAYGAAQALETSQLRQGSASSLRLGAGEQLPEAPASQVPEVTAPVPLVAGGDSWVAPVESYEAPAYEPAAYAAASPVAESYEAASYEAPSYEAASPGYEAASYEAPSYEAASPGYEAASYEAPSYEPTYPAPSHESFEAPAPAYDSSYEIPSYEPPTVVTPSYDDAYAAPGYEASSFAAAPSYEPPAAEAPSYAAYEPPAYEPPAYEPAPSYEAAPVYEPAPYEPPAYEPAPSYEAAPAYEPAQYEPPAYEPPAEAPAYDISYPSSFDVPAVEPAYEPAAYAAAPYEPAPFEPAPYEAPAYEAPAAAEYAPSFEMVPEETPYAPAYEPAREPSSFDTSFEPAAAAESYGATEDVRFAREQAYDLPSEEEIALEKQPEPALEDTNIWEAEEEDDEPTQIGQSTAAVPQVLPDAAGAPAPVGQQTVRLDISQLQSHASQLAQERYGDDTADVAPPAAAAWQAPAAAPAAYAPTYSPPSFAPSAEPAYDQAEAPTVLGRGPLAPPAAAPPSPAGFAGPAATEQAPGGFGAGGFGAGEAKEPGGSTEVRPPADLIGPGLAFAAHSQGQRASVASGVEETLREEARRLARLLVSEIKLYNEEIIEEGRRSGNIYDRLKDDIDRSRQMYEERIDPRLTDQEDYFYQELVQRLAGGDAKLLGL